MCSDSESRRRVRLMVTDADDPKCPALLGTATLPLHGTA
jgi:hypothetical protein